MNTIKSLAPGFKAQIKYKYKPYRRLPKTGFDPAGNLVTIGIGSWDLDQKLTQNCSRKKSWRNIIAAFNFKTKKSAIKHGFRLARS